MNIQFRRWLPLLALLGVLQLLTLQPVAASVQAAAQSTDTPTLAPPVLIPKLGSVPITAQNAAQVKQLMQIGDGGAQNVCWSPDGNTLAVATTIGLQLYNARDWSKAPISLGPAFNANACNWSPHSRYIALTNGQPSQLVPWKVAIWRVSDGTLFKTFNDASAVVWSPDGQSFFTIDHDKHSRLWNGVTGALLNRFDTTNATWSLDSRFVAFIDSGTVLHVWADQSNSVVFSYTPGWVQFVWAPNSHWLALRNEGGAVGLAVVDAEKSTIAPVTQLKQTGWNDMSWSPDSAQLATAGRNSIVVIWNVVDDSQVKTFSIDHDITAVAWSPTGDTIAVKISYLSTNDSQDHYPDAVEVLDIQTGQSLLKFDQTEDAINKMGWSPTGHFLVLDVYIPGEGDGFSGTELWVLQNDTPRFINTESALAWSPDDVYLAFVPELSYHGGCCNGPVQINDLRDKQNAQNAKLYPREETINSLFIAWSPNGHYLAWKTTQWNLSDGTLETTGRQDCKRCYDAFVWGADSNFVATYSYFSQGGPTITVGSNVNGNPQKIIGMFSEIFNDGAPDDLALSENNHYVAFNAGKHLYIWDIDQNVQYQKLSGHNAEIKTLRFSPDSKLIASGSVDSTIRIWQVDSGAALHILNGHTATVNRVVWSPDGKELASASDDQTVRIWNPRTGALLQTLKGHTGSVVSVQWSPDGKLLASASKDGMIKLWDAADGTLLNTVRGHVGAINDLSWSPDGNTLATAGVDGTIRLWGVH